MGLLAEHRIGGELFRGQCFEQFLRFAAGVGTRLGRPPANEERAGKVAGRGAAQGGAGRQAGCQARGAETLCRNATPDGAGPAGFCVSALASLGSLYRRMPRSFGRVFMRVKEVALTAGQLEGADEARGLSVAYAPRHVQGPSHAGVLGYLQLTCHCTTIPGHGGQPALQIMQGIVQCLVKVAICVNLVECNSW